MHDTCKVFLVVLPKLVLFTQICCQVSFPDSLFVFKVCSVSHGVPLEFEDDEQLDIGEDLKEIDNRMTSTMDVDISSMLDPSVESSEIYSSKSGYSINALLRVDEDSLMTSGNIKIDSSIKWATLLQPLPSTKCDFTSNELHVCSQQLLVVKLDDYLYICTHHFCYTVDDVLYASALYERIDCSGVNGITLEEIKTDEHLCQLHTSLDLDTHIQALMNFRMVS